MASNRRLFREEALVKQGQVEPMDGLLRVTAPHERFILAGLGIILLGAVLWSVLGTLESSVSTRCVLARPGERHAVVSAATGTVVEVLRDIGDEVEAGDPVLRLKLPDLEREVRVARALVALAESHSQDPDGDTVLAAARVELLELEALESEGGLVVSPVAGEIVSQEVTVGQAVSVGDGVALVRGGGEQHLEAVAALAPGDARRVRADMEAQVRLTDRPGGAALEARIVEVSSGAVTAPSWPAEHQVPLPAGGHSVRAALRAGPDVPDGEGAGCRLKVILQRRAPISLLT